MSPQSTILNSFPKEFTPRPLQEKLIEEIQEKINSGAKVVLLSAPTGIGKSLIAASVAGYFRLICCNCIKASSGSIYQRHAMDKPNKGMPNFACHKMMEKHGMISEKISIQNKWTWIGTYFDKKIKECNYKPKLSDVAEGKIKQDDCLYYLQKYQSLVSSHSIWNYVHIFK